MKTKTIRNKILLVFSLAFFALLIILFLVNRFFMMEYFIRNNSNNMRRESNLFIQELPNGNAEEATATLTKNTGGRLFLFTQDLNPIDVISSRQEELPYSVEDGKLIYEQASAAGGYFAVMGGDEPTNQTMVYAVVFGDGKLLVLTKAMGLVEEASRLFSRFMLSTSLIVYLIGLVIIFFISRNLSRPVTEMKRITHKMANLEFDEKLKVKGSDEIAELTHSVNQMADKLSATIGKLNASNAQLEQELSKERSLEKMRRRFVSDVSHELKNPISIILGYADGLIQNVPKTEKDKRDYYRIIADEANGMNALTKNLLDLSSYESGSFTLEKETFELGELIDNAIERFGYISSEKQIHIDYQPKTTCTITADRLRTQQVINNLLGNAYKYVDTGGTIRISAKQADGRTAITIANTGPLIRPKDLDMLWNSFYQANTQKSGSGLGLAIVKSIIEMHKGECRAYVENDLNCFEVIL